MKFSSSFLFLLIMSTCNFSFGSWDTVEEQYQIYENELEMRKNVEERSYEFTTSLCLEFKIRSNVLKLERKNFSTYVRTAIDWNVITFYGAKSVYADSEYHRLIFFKSNFLHRLYISDGYQRAISECADEIGISKNELDTLFKNKVNIFNDTGNIVGLALGGGAVKQGVGVIGRTRAGKFLGNKFRAANHRLGRFKKWTLGSLSAAGLTFVGYSILNDYGLLYEILGLKQEDNLNEGNQRIDSVESKLEEISSWAKVESYKKFARSYLELTSGLTCHLQCELSTELSEDLRSIKEEFVDIQKMYKEINSFIANDQETFYSTLSSALEKEAKSLSLTELEKWTLNLASKYGSLDLIINIIDNS